MCRQCGIEIEQMVKGPLPITEVCLCPPDFVMLFKVAGEDRWVVGRRICDLVDPAAPVIDEMSHEDSVEYLAGNYSHWSLHCLHCGQVFAEGRA
jgi:hypothetical protein